MLVSYNEFMKKCFLVGMSVKRIFVIITAGILIIGTAITLSVVLSKPSWETVFRSPINDEELLEKIVQRINEEEVKLIVNSGFLVVKNEEIARRIRTILIMEELIPPEFEPWVIYGMDRWTITDFERNVRFRRAQEGMVLKHIKSIDGIEDASLIIAWPDRAILLDTPITVAVRIKPKPGSDIMLSPQNRIKIEGIRKLLMYAFPGLTTEYINITDYDGYSLELEY